MNETYTKITDIIDELLGSCYFNDIENLLELIFDKTLHWDMQANDYWKDLFKESTKYNDISIDFNKNINKFL